MTDLSAFTLQDYVDALRILPAKPQIVFDSDAENHLFLRTEIKYISASLWLKHFLLGEELHPKACQPPAINIKPFAEFLAAMFKLTVAVHSRTGHSKLLRFSRPVELWFYCCVKMSESELRQQGLTDSPLLLGKRKAWNAGLKMFSDLESLSYKLDPTPTFEDDPGTLVIVEAQAIARVDKDFYKNHLLVYTQAARQALKQNHKSQNVQFHYLLPDGTLFVTGKNKKLHNIKRKYFKD